MTHPLVITETRDGICTIILNRPERRNAVDRKTADALREAFEHFGTVRPAATMISADLMDPRMLIEIEVIAFRQA